jgi:hypothetical protein
MRAFWIVALCAILVGCAASKQEVVARLGQEYIGQNVDTLVVKLWTTNKLVQNEQRPNLVYLATLSRHGHRHRQRLWNGKYALLQGQRDRIADGYGPTA